VILILISHEVIENLLVDLCRFQARIPGAGGRDRHGGPVGIGGLDHAVGQVEVGIVVVVADGG